MTDKLKLIVDIKSISNMCKMFGADLSQWLGIVAESGVVFWDSDDGGIEPKVVDENFEGAVLIDRAKLTKKEREKLDKAFKEHDHSFFKEYKEAK